MKPPWRMSEKLLQFSYFNFKYFVVILIKFYFIFIMSLTGKMLNAVNVQWIYLIFSEFPRLFKINKSPSRMKFLGALCYALEGFQFQFLLIDSSFSQKFSKTSCFVTSVVIFHLKGSIWLSHGVYFWLLFWGNSRDNWEERIENKTKPTKCYRSIGFHNNRMQCWYRLHYNSWRHFIISGIYQAAMFHTMKQVD